MKLFLAKLTTWSGLPYGLYLYGTHEVGLFGVFFCTVIFAIVGFIWQHRLGVKFIGLFHSLIKKFCYCGLIAPLLGERIGLSFGVGAFILFAPFIIGSFIRQFFFGENMVVISKEAMFRQARIRERIAQKYGYQVDQNDIFDSEGGIINGSRNWGRKQYTSESVNEFGVEEDGLTESSTSPLSTLPRYVSPQAPQDGRSTGEHHGSSSSSTPNIATLPTFPGNVRDPAGHLIQQTYGQDAVGNTTVRNAAGNIIAVQEAQTSAGTSAVRDGGNRLLGVIENRSDGSAVVRDAAGHYQTFIEKPQDLGGVTLTNYRNANGWLLGTKEVSRSGQVTYRKASGVLCGPDFK